MNQDPLQSILYEVGNSWAMRTGKKPFNPSKIHFPTPGKPL